MVNEKLIKRRDTIMRKSVEKESERDTDRHTLTILSGFYPSIKFDLP